ncbi:MAG: AMP-binding protein [Pseudorhodoferax sp.]
MAERRVLPGLWPDRDLGCGLHQPARQPPARRTGRAPALGRPRRPGAEIGILDPEGRECPRGQVGEIVIRGPMVTSGYWKLPEATAQALRNGWLHTGDGGRMDEDGFIFIADRLKDMIISGGENVYSGEVEAALRSHADVIDAAVIGVPDARWGEAVHAVVVLRPGVAESAELAEGIRAHCRDAAGGLQVPAQPGLRGRAAAVGGRQGAQDPAACRAREDGLTGRHGPAAQVTGRTGRGL